MVPICNNFSSVTLTLLYPCVYVIPWLLSCFPFIKLFSPPHTSYFPNIAPLIAVTCFYFGDRAITLHLLSVFQVFLRPCAQVSSCQKAVVEPLSPDDWDILVTYYFLNGCLQKIIICCKDINIFLTFYCFVHNHELTLYSNTTGHRWEITCVVTVLCSSHCWGADSVKFHKSSVIPLENSNTNIASVAGV